jgi:hypothetical protein
VLRVAAETETTQENILDRLDLDEVDPGYQLLTGRIDAVILSSLFSLALLMLLNFRIFF